MNEIKEINRRCEVSDDSGIACGPASIVAISAEMEIERNGEKLFLNCTWCDEASDAVSFEVTKESIFDIMTMKSDDMELLESIREAELECFTSYDGEYEGEFPKQYKELVQMVKDKIVEEGLIDLEEYEDGVIEWDF